MIVRKVLFGLLTFCLMIAVVELFAFLGVSYLHGHWVTHRDIQRLQDLRREAPSTGFHLDMEDEQPPRTVGRNLVVHPYVGFVPIPLAYDDQSPKATAADFGFPNNARGIFHRRSPGTLIVALFGGSVAWGFPPSAQRLLEDLLTESGRFQRRELIFLNLAYPGYKQPQQLMILNYLLVLGAEFDIVVNLDGFNEVTLPVNENLHRGVFPFFPRAWFFRVGNLDPQTKISLGEIAFLEAKQRALAELYAAAPFRYSMTAGLMWTVRDRFLAAQLAKRTEELARIPDHEQAYVTTGPHLSYTNRMETFHDLVQVWKRSSNEMNHLCIGHGMQYYHCLQPTLFLPGSKPLSGQEQEFERRFPNPNKRCAREAYPLLMASGHDLADEGVAFIDLTRLFEHTEETIYHDGCHLSSKGYDMVARRLAEFMSAQ